MFRTLSLLVYESEQLESLEMKLDNDPLQSRIEGRFLKSTCVASSRGLKGHLRWIVRSGEKASQSTCECSRASHLCART